MRSHSQNHPEMEDKTAEADDTWRSGHGQAENTADGCPGITREAFQTNYGTVMEKIHVHNEETVVREERFLRQTKC